MVNVDIQYRFFMVYSTGFIIFRAFRNRKGALFGSYSVLFGPM
jgi:hypothetical protein